MSGSSIKIYLLSYRSMAITYPMVLVQRKGPDKAAAYLYGDFADHSPHSHPTKSFLSYMNCVVKRQEGGSSSHPSGSHTFVFGAASVVAITIAKAVAASTKRHACSQSVSQWI